MSTSRYVRFFEEFGIDDVPLVGGKNASLGEMYRNLSSQGVRVPNGFAITAEAYRYMFERGRRLGSSACRARRARPDRRRRPGAPSASAPARSSTAPDSPTISPPRSWTPTASFSRSTARTSVSLCGARRPPRTCRRRASPANRIRSQHQRRREPARRLPPLLRQPVHRPRHSLPSRPGLRPLQGRALDRRDEDGALRSRLVGGDVLPRHRVGLSRRRLHHRRLRPGRERRSRRGRPGRVLRPQADLSRRATAPCCAAGSATRP